MFKEKEDAKEATERAAAMRANGAVKAWMRRARKLFRELPPGTWIYWQESDMCLMAEGPDGEKYVNGYNHGGSDQSAIIDSVTVPRSDAGAW